MDSSALKTDDFIVYGTAVEQLEEDELLSSKPVPIQEQIATDEKGRRRFHGAFTGGFSAGYFNTVGSIEGWTPRTFQSSRQQKGPAREQRPEDYMDTEDFSHHGIAPKKIMVSDSFSTRPGEGSKRTYGANAAPVIRDLLAPLKNSFGVVLLKKLGWKPGQGIGPRVTKQEKFLRAVKAGKLAVDVLEEEQEDDSLTAGKLFAPDDVTPMKMDPKTNFHGIGYKGLDMSSGLLSSSKQHINLFDIPESSSTALAVPTATAKLKKKGIHGQAFGVGAFEREDDDIYAADDMSRYDRILGGVDKEDGKKRKDGMKSIEAPGAPKVLEGFQRGSAPFHQPKLYPPPEIPKGFQGVHMSFEGTARQSASSSASAEVRPLRHDHDARSRAAVLNDEPKIPPTMSSVFDLIPANQRSRIPVFQKAGTLQPVTMTAVEEPKAVIEASVVKTASIDEQRRNNLALYAGSVTMESKMTFRPFDKDPAKQLRYEMFLKKRHNKDKDAIEEPWINVGSSMTEWEREREKGEFFRAAALYRPMSGAMAARFTSAKNDDVTSNQVDVPVDAGDVSKERKAAAEKKIFGKLTRDVYEWHPDRLICKRFNVPNPYPTSTLVGLLTVKRDKFSLFNFLNVPGETASGTPASEIHTSPASAASKESAPDAPSQPSSSVQKEVLIKRLMLPETAKPHLQGSLSENNDQVVERPPMDIFRAIFQSSDAEDEGEEESEDNVPLVETSATVDDDPLTSLFEFDRQARNLAKKEYEVKPESVVVIGPAKPPPEVLATYAALSESLHNIGWKDDSDSEKHRKKSKHKKAHKHDQERKKTKSKKHRKKHKKERRNVADESSSSSDDVPGPRPARNNNDVVASSQTQPVHVVEPSEVDLLSKLKKAMTSKRLTAADFM